MLRNGRRIAVIRPSRRVASTPSVAVAVHSNRCTLRFYSTVQSYQPNPQASNFDTSLQVTDPLLIYRAKVANGELEQDEEQIRALIQLRNLSRTLQDYTPPAHLLGILNNQSSFQPPSASPDLETQSSTLSKLRRERSGDASSNKEQVTSKQITELTKWLNNRDELESLGLPKGLMLTGPPGTGKSLMAEIFYESLPVQWKFRRHYHHLLLEVYRIIWAEAERRRLSLRGGAPPTPLVNSESDLASKDTSVSGPKNVFPKHGTGVYWKKSKDAQDQGSGKSISSWTKYLSGMPFFRPDSESPGGFHEPSKPMLDLSDGKTEISNTTLPLHVAATLFLKYGHVLWFDEVQLVDVASAGILRRVLEGYWKLGGVVIATSNRVPEDLYSSNVQRSQLLSFLEMLRSRCPLHEMRADRDFRRLPFNPFKDHETESETHRAQSGSEKLESTFFIKGQEAEFEKAVEKVVMGRQGVPTSVQVYGRQVSVPYSIPSSSEGPSVCRFTFSQLCDSPLGPADYLTLASNFHTFILGPIPQMTLLHKNQARRLITFLDAVYEAGCRLIFLSDSKPDDLFFPDAEEAAKHARQGPAAGMGKLPIESGFASGEPDDVVDMSARGSPSPFKTPERGSSYPEEETLRSEREKKKKEAEFQELMSETLIQSETLSEAIQDVEEGFRPNISTYKQSADSSDSTKARDRGDLAREEQEKKLSDKIGFKQLSIFTGEDERFSYQRAVSRLYEMSHPNWGVRRMWKPLLDGEIDNWRGGNSVKIEPSVAFKTRSADWREGDGATLDFADEASYETSTFPSRTSSQTPAPASPSYPAPDFSSGPVGRNKDLGGPPKLSNVHVWGVRDDWSGKAGKWGKGVRALSPNQEEKEELEREEKKAQEMSRRRREGRAGKKDGSH